MTNPRQHPKPQLPHLPGASRTAPAAAPHAAVQSAPFSDLVRVTRLHPVFRISEPCLDIPTFTPHCTCCRCNHFVSKRLCPTHHKPTWNTSSFLHRLIQDSTLQPPKFHLGRIKTLTSFPPLHHDTTAETLYELIEVMQCKQLHQDHSIILSWTHSRHSQPQFHL